MAVKSLIETVTVGAGGAASIEFTDIPQDGSDLVLVWSVRTVDNITQSIMRLVLNGDTGSNYAWVRLWGTGSTVSSSSGAAQTTILNGYAVGDDATANTFGNSSVYISNYSSSGTKSVSNESVTENNASTAYQFLGAGSYSGGAVTSLLIRENSSTNLAQYSTASLYKIKYD